MLTLLPPFVLMFWVYIAHVHDLGVCAMFKYQFFIVLNTLRYLENSKNGTVTLDVMISVDFFPQSAFSFCDCLIRKYPFKHATVKFIPGGRVTCFRVIIQVTCFCADSFFVARRAWWKGHEPIHLYFALVEPTY